MEEIKDTKQATVRITYDGKVHKRYHGPKARRRFENEVRVLRYLEKQGCSFVPRLLEADPSTLSIVTTSCGRVVDRISEEKLTALFLELEQFGVRHEDAFARNVTYDQRLGRFCLIDFEFATILATGEGLVLADVEGNYDPTKQRLERETSDD
jgi:tRNA A-37 threonylcarbamoyl transferase component Bud32